MRRMPVTSSNLAAIGYDETSRILEVEFKDGSVYQYSGVPSSVHEALMGVAARGESVGRYFDQHVKKAGYLYSKL